MMALVFVEGLLGGSIQGELERADDRYYFLCGLTLRFSRPNVYLLVRKCSEYWRIIYIYFSRVRFKEEKAYSGVELVFTTALVAKECILNIFTLDICVLYVDLCFNLRVENSGSSPSQFTLPTTLIPNSQFTHCKGNSMMVSGMWQSSQRPSWDQGARKQAWNSAINSHFFLSPLGLTAFSVIGISSKQNYEQQNTQVLFHLHEEKTIHMT